MNMNDLKTLNETIWRLAFMVIATGTSLFLCWLAIKLLLWLFLKINPALTVG